MNFLYVDFLLKFGTEVNSLSMGERMCYYSPPSHLQTIIRIQSVHHHQLPSAISQHFQFMDDWFMCLDSMFFRWRVEDCGNEMLCYDLNKEGKTNLAGARSVLLDV